MDDDLTIFNYMWSESNFNTTEYDITYVIQLELY